MCFVLAMQYTSQYLGRYNRSVVYPIAEMLAKKRALANCSLMSFDIIEIYIMLK